ncbi:unnamed protein product [Orchesella dallaii]|uniref:Uncharacterized protein n=1 Tax=Orchesella dallaii TaxID=48710 RepID=A0ABP1QZA4_9HEXA
MGVRKLSETKKIKLASQAKICSEHDDHDEGDSVGGDGERICESSIVFSLILFLLEWGYIIRNAMEETFSPFRNAKFFAREILDQGIAAFFGMFVASISFPFKKQKYIILCLASWR